MNFDMSYKYTGAGLIGWLLILLSQSVGATAQLPCHSCSGDSRHDKAVLLYSTENARDTYAHVPRSPKIRSKVQPSAKQRAASLPVHQQWQKQSQGFQYVPLISLTGCLILSLWVGVRRVKNVLQKQGYCQWHSAPNLRGGYRRHSYGFTNEKE